MEYRWWSHWSDRFGPYAERLVLHADLRAEFSGLSFTDRKGEFAGRITAEDWQAVIAMLNESGFISMASSYWPEHNIHDAGHRRVTVTRGGAERSVEEYAGSGPDELWALTKALAALSDRVAWHTAGE